MKAKPKDKQGAERRRAKRTVVLESFNLFLVIPEKHGMVRIYLRDLSRVGLAFHTEMEKDFRSGQEFGARLYLNPALYLPLNCRVVRVGTGEVAVEFPELGPGEAISRLQDFLASAETHGVLVE